MFALKLLPSILNYKFDENQHALQCTVYFYISNQHSYMEFGLKKGFSFRNLKFIYLDFSELNNIKFSVNHHWGKGLLGPKLFLVPHLSNHLWHSTMLFHQQKLLFYQLVSHYTGHLCILKLYYTHAEPWGTPNLMWPTSLRMLFINTLSSVLHNQKVC